MAASDNLSPSQFGPLFHGTSHPFEVGEVVEPRNGAAWVTSSGSMARTFAQWKSDTTGNPARVFQVEPLDPSEVAEVPAPHYKVFKSTKGFKVVGNLD